MYWCQYTNWQESGSRSHLVKTKVVNYVPAGWAIAAPCCFSDLRLGKKNDAARVHAASAPSSMNTLRKPLDLWKCTIMGIAIDATPNVTR